MERADGFGDASHVHIAMPRLAGLPAYARPPRHIAPAARLLDPDDLPLEAYRTEDDRAAYLAAARGSETATDERPVD